MATSQSFLRYQGGIRYNDKKAVEWKRNSGNITDRADKEFISLVGGHFAVFFQQLAEGAKLVREIFDVSESFSTI